MSAFDNASANSQAETGPLPNVLGCREGFEQPIADSFTDPGPIVFDDDEHTLSLGLRSDSDPAVSRITCIDQEIQKHLL